jgi:hypothetical protein
MMWLTLLVSLWLLAPVYSVYGRDPTDMIMEGGGVYVLIFN